MTRISRSILWYCTLLILLCASPFAFAVSYDIVYVRAPRTSDSVSGKFAEVFTTTHAEPGQHLILLHPDGNEEILVSAGENGAIIDPLVSFDAQWVYYAHLSNVRDVNVQRGNVGGVSRHGADIWKIHLGTRQKVQLTFQEWTPTPTIAHWHTDHRTAAPPAGKVSLGYGIFNTGPCQLPGNKLMFTSSRNGLLPVKYGYTFPNFQLFVLDETTGIVDQVGYLNLHGALHPVVLTDGRVMFSSGETQGRRDPRAWGIWAMYPDGRAWEPLMSAFVPQTSLHWQAQLSKGTIIAIGYYNLNNRGFGAPFRMHFFPKDQPLAAAIPRFGSHIPTDPTNPVVELGYNPSGTIRKVQFSFSPVGLANLMPFAHHLDQAADYVNGYWLGKVTQPAPAPNSDMLIVWTPGPANSLNRPPPSAAAQGLRGDQPTYDAGIYLLKNETPAYTSTDLVLVKNDPQYNEQQPRAVVPYHAIYGIAQPPAIPWVPNDGTLHTALPAGTPFGLVGTSSFYKRNTAPGVLAGNFSTQGADTIPYVSEDIYSVRILLMEPQSHLSYGGAGSGAHANPVFEQPYTVAGGGPYRSVNERLKILGEIPLRKYQADGTPVLDVDGNPDTSFLAKIPADHVFTFQTLDHHGSALNTSQTWHQLRPGEVRTNCGGCHAHAQVGTDFATTVAGQPGFPPVDLTQQMPTTIEYADIAPLLVRVCPECAGKTPQQVATMFTRVYESRNSLLLTEKTPSATPDEQRLLRTWIDLGSAISLVPKAVIQDTTPWREWNTRPALHLQIVRSSTPSCPMGCIPESTGNTSLSIGTFSYQGAQVVSVTRSDQAGEFASAVMATEHQDVWHLPLEGTGQAVFTVRAQDGMGLWTEKRLAARW